MAKERDFYFTYSSDAEAKMPHIGGWTVIKARNKDEAIILWQIAFPGYVDEYGQLNYAGCYSEEQFAETKMPTNGNFGKYCWEIINLDVNVLVSEK